MNQVLDEFTKRLIVWVCVFIHKSSSENIANWNDTKFSLKN